MLYTNLYSKGRTETVNFIKKSVHFIDFEQLR